MGTTMKTASHLLSLLTAMLLLATIALRRDGRLLGHSPVPDAPGPTAADGTAFLENRADGTVVINTAIPGAGINGYMGPTPLYIHLKDGQVTLIEAQPNQDTPEFFSATLEDGFREKWYGKTPREALAVSARPVTGATYSSTAFIQNVQVGLAAYLSAQGESAEAPAAAMSGIQREARPDCRCS